VIAPGYTPGALEILKTKRKGGYNIVRIDPDYAPEAVERKDVFGVTFEQGRNALKIGAELLQNIVTANKTLPESAKRDLIIALITLKYTQSNSVCYVKDGQAIGIGAGQQSRIHCTRLAGGKADNWWLRRHPKILALTFPDGIARPERDNRIDTYISDGCGELLTRAERAAWLAAQSGVALGSDAFFPFGDNIERAAQSGVQYIAQPGGSIRDDNVIAACDKYNMVMAFTGVRLFHH
jgi:AICAR transformylase/IMP cyclohydrolase PurH